VAAAIDPPVFLFDGDCAFCSSCARWIERRIPTPTRILAWQHTQLAPLGVPEAEVADAVVMVGVDLERRLGPDAFAQLLRSSTSGGWRALGGALAVRPVAALAWPIYRLIARNRHRLPGGTPQCSMPPAERGLSR
jgi:predicted DCC family thiol-disulfide oxidoreductase YuxK